jgi:hypothetical protein
MTLRSLTQTDGRTTRINFPRNDSSVLAALSTRAANCSQLRLFVQTTIPNKNVPFPNPPHSAQLPNQSHPHEPPHIPKHLINP